MEEEVTESKMMHRGGQCVQRLEKAELPTAFAGIEGEVCGKMRGQWQEDRGWRRADGPGRQHPPLPVGLFCTPHRSGVTEVLLDG